MINIFTLIYILSAVILLLTGVLAVVVYSQISLFKEYSELKRKNDHLSESLAKQEGEVLIKAKEKAEEIIKTALIQATKIEKEAEANREELSKLLDKKLEEVVQNTVKHMQTMSVKFWQNYQKRLEAQEEQAINGMWAEIGKSKEEMLNRLKEKIFEITKTAVEETVRKSLDLEGHEELIIEAVEEAIKQEGV